MRAVRCAAVIAGLLFGSQAAAQVTIPEEYSKTVEGAGEISAAGPELFGDSVNLYTGATTFSTTDVSLPGNGALPVAIGRQFSVRSRGSIERSALLSRDGTFADWDLDIPHLSGVFAQATGWQLGGASGGTNSRCSAAETKPPIVVGSFNGLWMPNEYWSGYHLHVPGAGGQEMMAVTSPGPVRPTDGKTYRWVTRDLWYFSCLPATANGVPGEAFLARSPSGMQYRFDWVATRTASPLSKERGSGIDPYGASSTSSMQMMSPDGDITTLNRSEVWILPTRVDDRFGNYVTYAYDPNHPWRLQSITASDGRQITLTYNAAGHVATVSDGSRTWTYSYNGGLTGVGLPDGSAWQIDFSTLREAYTLPVPPTETSGMRCTERTSKTVQPVLVGTMTHPSGAIGTFTFQSRMHGRSYVPKECVRPNYQVLADYATYPFYFDAVGLTQKAISGPGMATMQWTYTYGPLNNSWEQDCSAGCPAYKTVEIQGPSGRWERHTFSNRFRQAEGKLLKLEVGPNSSNVLSTSTTTYLTNPSGQAYPAKVGLSPYDRGDHADETWMPVISRVTTQQAQAFSWSVAGTCGGTFCLDAMARPTTVVRDGTDGSTTTTTYLDNLGKWVLGQVATRTVAGTQVERTDYTANAQPWKTWTFGKLQQTLTYNADGTLRTAADGKGNTTTFESWYRGIPRLITHADSTTQSAVVNAHGWITSVTDGIGSKTCYGYDAMGRVSSITYPSEASPGVCDTSAWNATGIGFVPVAGAEYGIAAGHWRQTVSTGNARKLTYYDALWRPVLVREYDTANVAGTSRFNATAYDAHGRTIHAAYPVATGPTMSNGTWTLPGVRTTYDALGRATTVKQDSELGVLTTTTQYLSGFQRRTTDPRGNVTTEQFQAFDAPSYDRPTRIDAPENTRTTIVRDVFGKPTSIQRGGSN